MRLSKAFVKSLEQLSTDQTLTANERLEAAGLLVRLYTSAPKTPSIVAEKPEVKQDTSTLARLASTLDFPPGTPFPLE